MEIKPYQSSAARAHGDAVHPKPSSLVIDCHGHMLVPEADKMVRPHLPASELDAVKYASALTREVNVQQNKDRHEELTGTAKRLADMDQMGIDVMVISPAPPQFNYQADAVLCHEASQLINNTLQAAAKDHSERLVAIGTVPLQDTDLAVRELERCIGDLGMPGIEIGANAGVEELSAERLEPFWARVQDLDATVLLHPTAFASDRFGAHYLTNVIGNPLETTLAVHYLIFDGVMERYPDLKIIVSHGGAFASHYAARMDHAWGARRDCSLHIDRPPTEYLKRFYFDGIVFAVDQLEFIARKFGTDRICLGTDYPFDMGEYDPVEHICQVSGLSDADYARMCGLNAMDLFGLNGDQFKSRPT
ncbi:MAG: amidohydrolase family protein [Hyphomicrobiaceae bacterium]